ncbi:MAG: hypothetical protein JWM37_125 [Candidatus Saccharibacteria bacterium]|nr:hypothetical protein [Candidatus Saccharibacteria bacterium]
MLKRLSNQRGDTIVEVLIALAVVAVVIVSAFAITNRSNKAIQSAQEADQATKLAQSQVEFLRSSKFTIGTDKCFKSNGQVTSLASECVVDSAGNPTTATLSYTVAISQSGSTYAVNTSWDSATGNGIANVTLYYRR